MGCTFDSLANYQNTTQVTPTKSEYYSYNPNRHNIGHDNHRSHNKCAKQWYCKRDWNHLVHQEPLVLKLLHNEITVVFQETGRNCCYPEGCSNTASRDKKYTAKTPREKGRQRGDGDRRGWKMGGDNFNAPRDNLDTSITPPFSFALPPIPVILPETLHPRPYQPSPYTNQPIIAPTQSCTAELRTTKPVAQEMRTRGETCAIWRSWSWIQQSVR